MLLWNQNIGRVPRVWAIAEGQKRYSPIVVRVTTNWTSGPAVLTLDPVRALKLRMRPQLLHQQNCPIDVASLIPKRSAEAVSKHTLGLDDYIN